MIPIWDDAPRRAWPIVTILLIAANLAAFFYELSLGSELPGFIAGHGAIPEQIFSLLGAGRFVSVALVLGVSMFLHAGWLHIGGNMLFLWVFGDNVEDRFGHTVFLIFYLFAGMVSMLAHAFSEPFSTAPAIGASGAVAAVLGAYLVLFPRSRVTVIVPLFLFFPVFQVSAVVVLGFWFFGQVASGVLALSGATLAPVAWWAHIGGFATGMVLGKVLGGRGRLWRR